MLAILFCGLLAAAAWVPGEVGLLSLSPPPGALTGASLEDLTELDYFGIDPGPEKSGWCVFYHAGEWASRLNVGLAYVGAAGVDLNQDVLLLIDKYNADKDYGLHVVIEEPVHYGTAHIGRSVLQTMRWAGRFEQHQYRYAGGTTWLSRPEVALTLCGQRAKKGAVNDALRSIFPRSNPGAQKKSSPLYGVKSHAWDALAVVIAHLERNAQYRYDLSPLRSREA